jgi:hypothetical protein
MPTEDTNKSIEAVTEESRPLQVCIFTTLHKNVKNLEF